MKPAPANLAAGATAGVILLALGVVFALTGSILPFDDWARGGGGQADVAIRAPGNSPAQRDVTLRPRGAPSGAGGDAGSGSGTGAGGGAAGGGTLGDSTSGDGGGGEGGAPQRVSAPPAGGPGRPPSAPPQDQQPSPGPAPVPSLPSVPGNGTRQPNLVQQLTKGVADTTRGLTDQTGNTLKGVNPQLGQAVTDTGRGVSDLVSGLGGNPR